MLHAWLVAACSKIKFGDEGSVLFTGTRECGFVFEDLVEKFLFVFSSQMSVKVTKTIKYPFLGCKDGAVVKALASHQCDPGSILSLGVICGLSLLVLYSAPRGFSPGTPVFPSPKKPKFDMICVNLLITGLP